MSVKIFSGRVAKPLSLKICERYGKDLNKMKINVFSDGEFITNIEESVRGDDVFVIQTLIPNSDNIFELLMIGDALERAGTKSITAIIPYLGYSRQDRKTKPREPITSKLLAKLICASGYDNVVTIDLHNESIQGFFDVPVVHLSASYIFIPYIKNLNLENLVFCSPDVGGTKRAKVFADKFDTDLVICHKHRPQANVVGEMKLIGDVKGKDVVIVDDMVDTAGTLTKAADLITEQGANSVRAMITHPVLSGGAYKNLEKSSLVELITTDTIPLRDPKEFIDFEKSTRKITVLSVDKMIAKAINKINKHESINDM